MRISGDPNDPGYRDDAGLFTVLLNGRRCGWETGDDFPIVTADEEEGLVIRYLRDQAGNYVTEIDAVEVGPAAKVPAPRDGRFVECQIHGVVNIIPPVAVAP